jgi:hypothetical protein
MNNNTTQQPATQEKPTWPVEIKALPLLAFAAIRSKLTGPYRAWLLARAINSSGDSKVKLDDLRDYFNHLGVSPRQQRRWLSGAIRSGLFRQSGEFIYYIRASKAAVILGAERIGYYASCKAAELVTVHNWRPVMLVGYLATHQAKRPVSQREIEQKTSISPRVQRNWLNGRTWSTKDGESSTRPRSGIIRRENYAYAHWKADEIQGVREEFGYNVFIGRDSGAVRQRLPDIYYVPPEVSDTFGSWRLKKDQKHLNSLFKCVEQRSGNGYRLYHECQQSLNKLVEKRGDDLAGRDAFRLVRAWESRNTWKTIPLCNQP